MKTLILLLLAIASTTASFGQDDENSKQNENNLGRNCISASFRLFPTQNMWTFLKLNTRNGKVWQVQYDVKGENRFETILSLEPQVPEKNEQNDRFTLYETKNMYTFILLDQQDGRTWQVQWSINTKERFVIPIY